MGILRIPTDTPAMCDRCGFKIKYLNRYRDPNKPGLLVCVDCVDLLDPEFKPQRQMEQVGLPDARPNQSLVPDEES